LNKTEITTNECEIVQQLTEIIKSLNKCRRYEYEEEITLDVELDFDDDSDDGKILGGNEE
ncbi:unnamed protein product, partial [Didymodactylos carnosus]